ncbi:TetR/AcrR family transcriptional regulator [Gymnodinialimonas sp.]
MSDINAKTQRWLEAMAAHVLEHGLTTASLRPLAKAAGTSDRMLIYHFGDKDGVIAALLSYLAEGFLGGLDAAIPEGRFPSRGALLGAIVAVMRNPVAAGYARIWLDIVAASARGEGAYAATGGAMIDGFVAWVLARLPEGTTDPDTAARALLTVLEGVMVMDAVGHGDVADAAIAWFSSDSRQ